MPLEVLPDRLVAVVATPLADELHGDHFTVAQVGSKSPGAEPHPTRHFLQFVIHPTKHRDDKLVNWHGYRPLGCDFMNSSTTYDDGYAASRPTRESCTSRSISSRPW